MYVPDDALADIDNLLEEIMKMLNKLQLTLKINN